MARRPRKKVAVKCPESYNQMYYDRVLCERTPKSEWTIEDWRKRPGKISELEQLAYKNAYIAANFYNSPLMEALK